MLCLSSWSAKSTSLSAQKYKGIGVPSRTGVSFQNDRKPCAGTGISPRGEKGCC